MSNPKCRTSFRDVGAVSTTFRESRAKSGLARVNGSTVLVGLAMVDRPPLCPLDGRCADEGGDLFGPRVHRLVVVGLALGAFQDPRRSQRGEPAVDRLRVAAEV